MLARGFAAGRKTLSAALCAAALCSAAPALAQGSAASDDLARRHFESGVAYLEESDLENAMKAFQKAFDLSRRPTILLNIATVQERRGDLAAAIVALEGYLSAEPHGEHAATTRLRIQNLQKRLDAAQAEVDAKPATAAPTTPPANAAAPTPAPVPPVPPPAPAPVVADEGAPIAVYGLLGLGGAATLTAIVTGVLANGEYARAERDCSPHCTRSDVSTGKTLALVSTIATGAAIIGGGLGLTLLFTSSSAGAAAPRAEVRVGVSGAGPTGSVRYRF